MSPGQDPRRERRSQPHEKPENDHAAPASEFSSDMLRDIVVQTTESLAALEHVDPELQKAMLEVARQHAGQPMTVDPAGTALVEAVLRCQLPALADRASLLSRTARTVATSLLADPAARLRVEHLWARLAEDA